jgi:hypothetical protein
MASQKQIEMLKGPRSTNKILQVRENNVGFRQWFSVNTVLPLLD